MVSFKKEERRILIDLQKVLMNVVHDKRMKIIKHSSPILSYLVFLAHLWCAYAMALCLSWIVRRELGCVCVEHNYPKMWMD